MSRPAIRDYCGDSLYADVLAIASDPRPEVVAQQNTIWLCTEIPLVFRALAKEEPSLAGQCHAILRWCVAATSSIRRLPVEERGAVPPDTWEEARGER